MSAKVYFVSGIDTGVGKTIATALMARYLINKNVDAITMKLVQTGNSGFSEDLEVHRKIMRKSFPEDAEKITSPQIFSFPASPYLSAQLERKAVDIAHINRCVDILSERYDVLLIEGAGGLAVPLTEDLWTIDFAKQHDWPVILVTSGKLGSLNHTYLSFEAIMHRKMNLAGVLYNFCPEVDPCIDEHSFGEIKRYLKQNSIGVPVIHIPFCSENALPDIDFKPIFAL